MLPGRYACIDIGTVTCRMLVADVSIDEPGIELAEIAKEYAICNLGAGVDASGTLRMDAIERTLSAIDGFLKIRDRLDDPEHPILRTTVIATSATRDAKNSETFREGLLSRGLRLSTLSGSAEAELSFLGASSAFEGESIVVVDVGGGSTELSFGHAGAPPRHYHSFDIGCRRMTERFLEGSYPPDPASLAKARRWAFEQFSDWLRLSGIDGHGFKMIGVAGTATSAVTMLREMGAYDAKLVHGTKVSASELEGLISKISTMELSQIERMPGLDPKRAPVILAGLAILREAMESCGAHSFYASDFDILQGAILATASSSSLVRAD